MDRDTFESLVMYVLSFLGLMILLGWHTALGIFLLWWSFNIWLNVRGR